MALSQLPTHPTRLAYPPGFFKSVGQPLGQRPEGLGGGFIRLSAGFHPRGRGTDLRRPTGIPLQSVEEGDQASGYFTREIHSWEDISYLG